MIVVEYHPYLQQKRLVDWIRKQDIHIIAYASFGPVAFSKVLDKVSHLQSLLKHPLVEDIAKKHSVGCGQVVLGWAAQQDVVVIPKSVNPDRMKSNLDLFSFKLDDQDLEELSGLDQNARFNDICTELYGTVVPPLFD